MILLLLYIYFIIALFHTCWITNHSLSNPWNKHSIKRFFWSTPSWKGLFLLLNSKPRSGENTFCSTCSTALFLCLCVWFFYYYYYLLCLSKSWPWQISFFSFFFTFALLHPGLIGSTWGEGQVCGHVVNSEKDQRWVSAAKIIFRFHHVCVCVCVVPEVNQSFMFILKKKSKDVYEQDKWSH